MRISVNGDAVAAGKAKVSELELSANVDKEVLGLEVTVED